MNQQSPVTSIRSVCFQKATLTFLHYCTFLFKSSRMDSFQSFAMRSTNCFLFLFCLFFSFRTSGAWLGSSMCQFWTSSHILPLCVLWAKHWWWWGGRIPFFFFKKKQDKPPRRTRFRRGQPSGDVKNKREKTGAERQQTERITESRKS